MRKMLAAATVVLLFALGTPSWAWADFDKGMAAYKRGDYMTALCEWRPLAEHGHADAQYNIGSMYSSMYKSGRGVPQDDAEAVKWYRKAAEQGYVHSQYGLGLMYDESQGVPQDYANAKRWYRRAAEQGHTVAQLQLGIMYLDGRGVPQDYVQAHKWFNLAASRMSPGKVRDKATGNRDIVAGRMAPAQVAEAQRLAREWVAKHGKN